jgi:hypothetical protein
MDAEDYTRAYEYTLSTLWNTGTGPISDPSGARTEGEGRSTGLTSLHPLL